GGIANITILPQNATIDDIMAFDTGPGNMVIDEIINIITNGLMRFDKDGYIASMGNIDEELLEIALEHPYFGLPIPKTTGREVFGKSFARNIYESGKALGLSNEDIVATITTLTSRTISEAIRFFNVEEVIVGGGGAYNKTLIRMIRGELPDVKIKTHEDFGIPNQAKEALAFAILANEVVFNSPNNVPKATGAKRKVVLGKILPGG
ncbi:MAG: anhydro-N-acetylmuramic acid kinase, partial [bacterium]